MDSKSIFVTLCILEISTFVSPQFITPPSNVAANPGSEVELVCYAPAEAVHVWYLGKSGAGGTPLLSDGVRRPEAPPELGFSSNANRSLIFPNVNASYANKYSCYTIPAIKGAALIIIEPTRCTYNISEYEATAMSPRMSDSTGTTNSHQSTTTSDTDTNQPVSTVTDRSLFSQGGSSTQSLVSTIIPVTPSFQINVYCEASYVDNSNFYSWPPVIQCEVGNDKLMMVNSTETGKVLYSTSVPASRELDNKPIACMTSFNPPPTVEEATDATNAPSYQHTWDKTFRTPDNFTISGIQESYREGDSLNCSASGDPDPTISWEVETEEGFTMSSDGPTLTITGNMTGYTVATCIASNALSSERFDLVLNVTGDPYRTTSGATPGGNTATQDGVTTAPSAGDGETGALSTGQVAAIAVGSVCGGILVVLLVVAMFLKCRSTTQKGDFHQRVENGRAEFKGLDKGKENPGFDKLEPGNNDYVELNGKQEKKEESTPEISSPSDVKYEEVKTPL